MARVTNDYTYDKNYTGVRDDRVVADRPGWSWVPLLLIPLFVALVAWAGYNAYKGAQARNNAQQTNSVAANNTPTPDARLASNNTGNSGISPTGTSANDQSNVSYPTYAPRSGLGETALYCR